MFGRWTFAIYSVPPVFHLAARSGLPAVAGESLELRGIDRLPLFV